MKLVVVSGIQGSGKTTLIRELITRLGFREKTCGVIVNEDGDIKYDNVFIHSQGVRVESLRGG
ncbi:MAG: GTP-binding protein [Desulfomonilaceae bacterium]